MNELLKIILFFITLIILIYILTPTNITAFGLSVWPEPRKIIDYESDGINTSKQIFDIYSFSHISHGILFYFILKYFGFNDYISIYLSIIIEILWEIFENTPFIINKYRKKKEFENYKGDSIVNIIGDVIFTIFGIYLAQKNKGYSILYLLISETLLLPLHANLINLSVGSLIWN